MGRHVDVMRRYPKSNRPVDQRGREITAEHRMIAREFGADFFDGERLYGYGGYRYDGRWLPVCEDFREDYGLDEDAAILDIGCAKGFMVRDFISLMPDATVKGIDVSEYAIENADPLARSHVSVADARELPFEDDSFDLVISITTIHNLPIADVRRALQEVMRVSRKDAFVTLDAWRSEGERENLMKWNLTALTYMHVSDWITLFDEVGYTGDYDWFLVP